jgi:two-component system, sensor histidine kinase and response regulator
LKKILVVEDDVEIRKTIVDILESSGYKTFQACDGPEAMEYLETQIPDLVISDIMMPGINGYQVLENLRNNPATEFVPLIFLSAKTDYSDVRKGMANGADDYLAKPFRIKELIDAVKTQLNKKERVDQKFEQICVNISCSIPHELLTPIIPILGYPDVLIEDFESYSKEEILHMLDLIKFSGQRLHKTIRKFLRFLDVKLKVMDKNKNIKENQLYSSVFDDKLKESCKNIVAEHNRTGDLYCELDYAEVSIASFDFEFVIDEMLSNAIKFSEPGSRIDVTGKIINGMYQFSVTDHGCGMNQQNLNEILPFLQHERTKYEQQGLGLGLITIKKVMECYDGELTLESIPNEKTTCAVKLPLRILESNWNSNSIITSSGLSNVAV